MIVDSAYDRHTNSIHLQGIGRVPAKRADLFKIGDYMMWNYGGKSKIIGIKKQTKTQVVYITQTKDGSQYERRLKKDRLVAIGN